MVRKNTKRKSLPVLDLMSLVIIFVVVFLSLFLMLKMTLAHGLIGSDIDFHYRFAEKYSQGESALSDLIAGGPYPPLFQLFLSFFILLGVGVQAIYLLQVFLFPTILAVNAFVFSKLWNVRKAALAVAMLFSSIGFFDRAAQVIPQAFDVLLFPLAVYLFSKKKKIFGALVLTVMIYSHSLYAALFFGILLVFVSLQNLKNIRKRKFLFLWPFGLVILFSLPIILLTLAHLGSYFQFTKIDHARNLQETMILEQPLIFFEYLGIVISIVFLVTIIFLIHDILKEKKVHFSAPDKLAIIWILCLTPILFFGMHRFITYLAQPLAILVASNLMNIRFFKLHPPSRAILLVVIPLVSLFLGMMFWLVFIQTGNSPFIANYI